MMTILIADFDNTLDDALNGVTEAGAALGRMYRAALARAEAAEQRVAELEAEDTTGVAELRASIARMAANALEVGVSEFVQPAPEAQ